MNAEKLQSSASRRLLLKGAALTSALVVGCKSTAVYANPKGSHYDPKRRDSAAGAWFVSDAGAPIESTRVNDATTND